MCCKKCGAENPDNAVFCKKCGFRFAENQRVPAKPPSRVQMNAQPTNVRKRKPAFTTRKTNAAYLGGQLVSDVFFLGLSVFSSFEAISWLIPIGIVVMEKPSYNLQERFS